MQYAPAVAPATDLTSPAVPTLLTVNWVRQRERTITSSHHPVLGTQLQLTVSGSSRAIAAAQRRALAEFERLERMLSVYRPDSEMNRWAAGEVDQPGDELGAVLRLAADWQRRSDGAFNAATGVIADRWKQAVVVGETPDAAEMASLAASVRAPRFAVVDDRIERLGDCSAVNLNAVAKGYIVDRVAASLGCNPADCSARAEGRRISRVVVNAGGDLTHRGAGTLRVGVENPAQPFDNAAPLTVVTLENESMATSGSSRRGFRVGQRWFGHVIDPRNGQPVDHIASASVIAPDTATADVLATVLMVLTPEAGLAVADTLADVAVCIVEADGTLWRNDAWLRREARQ